MSTSIIPWGHGEITLSSSGTDLIDEFSQRAGYGVPQLFWLETGNRLVIFEQIISRNNIWSFWDQDKNGQFEAFCEQENIPLLESGLRIEDNLALTTFSLEGLNGSSIDKIFDFLKKLAASSRKQFESAITHYHDPLERPDFVVGIGFQGKGRFPDRGLRGRVIDKLGEEIYRANLHGRTESGQQFHCHATFPDISEYPAFPNHFPGLMISLIYLMPTRDFGHGHMTRKKEGGFGNNDTIEEAKKQRDAIRPHIKAWAQAHDIAQGDDLVIVGDNLAEVVTQLSSHPILIEEAKARVAAPYLAKDVTPTTSSPRQVGGSLPSPSRK